MLPGVAIEQKDAAENTSTRSCRSRQVRATSLSSMPWCFIARGTMRPHEYVAESITFTQFPLFVQPQIDLALDTGLVQAHSSRIVQCSCSWVPRLPTRGQFTSSGKSELHGLELLWRRTSVSGERMDAWDEDAGDPRLS